MSTSFKNKLYYFISGQLPEYVVAEYPQFVQFLTSYYKFLETSEQVHDVLLNNASWTDVDRTLDIFLPEFKKQYASDISDEALLSLRRLLKYITQYYEAKGSENATELFFRFMYNEKASVTYPGDYVLRASDGRWSRKKIIKIDTVAFPGTNIFDLKGKRITFKYLEFIPGEGSVLRTIQTSCFNVAGQIEPNIFQLEVDINPNYQFPDIISPVTNVDINDDGVPETIESLGEYDTHVYVIYNKTIYGGISKQIVEVLSIDTAGTNFRVDDSYLIGETGIEQQYFAEVYVSDAQPYVFETFTNNAVIRVREVTPRIQLPSPYVVDATPYFAEDYLESGFERRGAGISEIQLVNTGQKFAARKINEFAAVAYFESNYTLDPNNYASDAEELEGINTFTVELPPRNPRNLTGTNSTITFRTGLIYHAEGTYKDSSGFLSDVNRLQDNYYYQPYSYVIRSQQPFSTWKDLYSQSNHPAGFKVFSELQFIENIEQPVTVTDNFGIITITSLEVNEPLVVTELVSKNYQTSKSDSISTSDAISINIQKPISDTLTITDGTVNNIGLSVTDETPVIDFISSLTVGPAVFLTDAASVTDSNIVELNKIFTESVAATEFGNYYVQDYFSEDYFAESYVGTFNTF